MKIGQLFGESLVYAGAVFGYDLLSDFVPAFSLKTNHQCVVAKEIYYTGVTMTGRLHGNVRSWIDFTGLNVKAKGERLSFGYTWCFKYPGRYLWRMERKTRDMFLENDKSHIIATFKRTPDDQVEGRLVLRIEPDLPLLMLILATCKLGLVRIQASDAGVPYPIRPQDAAVDQDTDVTSDSVGSASFRDNPAAWLRQFVTFSKG
ncbi:hypothetical protein GGI25_005559 [Coemansia spiralis]|uniref:Uncharacterized protein n=1 Tax=Coemansia spiralis TaxID=417178 RepID=A0A9W8G2F6_9FUNG|nr:hypothetical protein GGI25_005559 [Coemansia spiralis]